MGKKNKILWFRSIEDIENIGLYRGYRGYFILSMEIIDNILFYP